MGRGSRSRKEDAGCASREIPFPIPLEGHLARVHLEKLNMFDELSRVTRDEALRHKDLVTGVSVRPPTPKRSGGPFGSAKLAPKRTRSVPSSSVQLLPRGERAATSTEPAELPEVPRKPPRGFFVGLNDPLAYPNEHETRRQAVVKAIKEKERMLAEGRSQSMGSLSSGVAESSQACRWDRVPISFGQSEYQTHMFPRSIEAIRTCGGGKDPRLTHPWQEFEKWREADWYQKNADRNAKK